MGGCKKDWGRGGERGCQIGGYERGCKGVREGVKGV